MMFSERLNQALDKANIPPKGKGRQVIVAKMFGVSQKGARKWLEGESIPDTKRLPEIAAKLGVRGEWLLTGQGPITPSPTDVDTRIEVLLNMATPRSRESLLRIVRAAESGRLTEDDLALLEQIAKRFAQE